MQIGSIGFLGGPLRQEGGPPPDRTVPEAARSDRPREAGAPPPAGAEGSAAPPPPEASSRTEGPMRAPPEPLAVVVRAQLEAEAKAQEASIAPLAAPAVRAEAEGSALDAEALARTMAETNAERARTTAALDRLAEGPGGARAHVGADPYGDAPSPGSANHDI